MSDKSKNYEWLGEDDELTGEKDVIAKEIMGGACVKLSWVVQS